MTKVLNGIFHGAGNIPVHYELHKDSTFPREMVVSAVFGIIQDKNGDVFLTKNHRGWEIPGGHIEEGENIGQALSREIHEEVGTSISPNPTLWGYKVLCSDEDIPRSNGLGSYPREGLILYYQGRSTGKREIAQGEEIIDSGVFPLEKAIEMVKYEVNKYILQNLD